MADDELIDEDERDRFAGVARPAADADTDDRPTTGRTDDAASARAEYERGREDERRFEHDGLDRRRARERAPRSS